ncbi:MAG: hypothetical protein EAY75_04985 [Bacteroidetes bacterium]|nr:MAG: hypothetical protein EAY75_04985 [Bacteroidota bacterium]
MCQTLSGRKWAMLRHACALPNRHTEAQGLRDGGWYPAAAGGGVPTTARTDAWRCFRPIAPQLFYWCGKIDALE